MPAWEGDEVERQGSRRALGYGDRLLLDGRLHRSPPGHLSGTMCGMNSPRITSILLNSRAGGAVSRAVGKQNAAKKASDKKSATKPTQTTIKGAK